MATKDDKDLVVTQETHDAMAKLNLSETQINALAEIENALHPKNSSAAEKDMLAFGKDIVADRSNGRTSDGAKDSLNSSSTGYRLTQQLENYVIRHKDRAEIVGNAVSVALGNTMTGGEAKFLLEAMGAQQQAVPLNSYPREGASLEAARPSKAFGISGGAAQFHAMATALQDSLVTTHEVASPKTPPKAQPSETPKR